MVAFPMMDSAQFCHKRSLSPVTQTVEFWYILQCGEGPDRAHTYWVLRAAWMAPMCRCSESSHELVTIVDQLCYG